MHALICSDLHTTKLKGKKRGGKNCSDSIICMHLKVKPRDYSWAVHYIQTFCGHIWRRTSGLFQHGLLIRCVYNIIRGKKGKNFRQTTDALIISSSTLRAQNFRYLGRTYHGAYIWWKQNRYLIFCKFVKNHNKKFWNNWNMAYPYLTIWCIYPGKTTWSIEL